MMMLAYKKSPIAKKKMVSRFLYNQTVHRYKNKLFIIFLSAWFNFFDRKLIFLVTFKTCYCIQINVKIIKEIPQHVFQTIRNTFTCKNTPISQEIRYTYMNPQIPIMNCLKNTTSNNFISIGS